MREFIINRELNRHRLADAVLMIGLLMAMASFWLAWPNRFYQRLIVLGLVAFYVVWGTLAHLHTDHVTRRVVYEYLGVGVVAGLVLLLVTL